MTNGNEPIYPVVEMEDGIAVAASDERGLTKREYFAAMALQGLLSVPTKATDAHTYLGAGAELAVIAADQLIEQLNKPTTNG